MSDASVSRLHEKRALARLIVAMEIKDLAAIESVRAERRLNVLTTISRAAGRRKRSTTTTTNQKKENDR